MKTHIVWACIAIAALVTGTQFSKKEVVVVEKPVEVVKVVEKFREAEAQEERRAERSTSVAEVQQSTQSLHSAPPSEVVSFERKASPERQKLHDRYQPFLSSLGLSPQQMERFVDLKIAISEARHDLQAAVEQSGAQGGSSGVAELRATLTEPMWSEIRQMLGPDGFKAYGEYERTSAYRPTVDSMFRAAAVSLSEQQADQITRLIIKNTELYRAKPTDVSHRARINWDGVLRDAEGFLSPAQVEVVKGRAARETPKQ